MKSNSTTSGTEPLLRETIGQKKGGEDDTHSLQLPSTQTLTTQSLAHSHIHELN
jgi:hypothetical protein